MTLRTFTSSHNFPFHFYETILPKIKNGDFGELTHIHYHNLLTDTSKEALVFLDNLGLPLEGIAWLKEHAIIMQRNLKEILELTSTADVIRELEKRNEKLQQLVCDRDEERASSREEL
ncbi:hypothetical protein BC351_31915 [Paenibacillus ferrarius]|uniref:Uncharacterized protein n=1 Tax=Paenibacillus ferrarius TaxID=1469647 RepID=A0A1V4HG59_9BACL|nr:hypothetical protein [Paenibacillus ferrarius]OPH53088.1 hypothetical protein BC351_31915 [Paenibacillus ferrarius]